MMFEPLVTTAQLHSVLTDDQVDDLYACDHSLIEFPRAENYRVCVYCGQVMWMVFESAYCNWQGKAVEGNV